MGIHAWTMMMMEGEIYEGEGEDIDHKVRIHLMEAAVEFQNEGREIMGAGTDNAHRVKELAAEKAKHHGDTRLGDDDDGRGDL